MGHKINLKIDRGFVVNFRKEWTENGRSVGKSNGRTLPWSKQGK